MLLYAYFTPKVENFESDHQYESNLESDVRFEIESNHEASLLLSHSTMFYCSSDEIIV